ncbi:putative chitin binding protein [Rosellinia necatrix]|uniref:Putative chitin binding protein n=1 Tax=Rosellinia necatrix TaxID=77044 RepID=A0A1S7UHW3_ROSNE|nr:putative chitin binding protein [Rosellinia necatrix]
MKYTTAGLVSLAALSGVQGHAVMTSPAPRNTGPKQLERCGAIVTAVLQRDLAGPIENAMKAVDASYNCNAYLCRGYQYEDNVSKLKAVSAGDVLTFHIDLVAGHHPGYANVSVVNLASNTVIGAPLVSWADWPDSTSGPPRNDITIPNTLASACDEGGKCAIQWFWWSISNSQTYESCVDFYVQ